MRLNSETRIFIMHDGDENSKEDCATKEEAIIRGKKEHKTPWIVESWVDEYNAPWNQHFRYNYNKEEWESR